MWCSLCGFDAPDRYGLAEHLAAEHPDAWEMAVAVVAMSLMGPGLRVHYRGIPGEGP